MKNPQHNYDEKMKISVSKIMGRKPNKKLKLTMNRGFLPIEKNAVIEMLKIKPGANRHELWRALGISSHKISLITEQLENEGVISKYKTRYFINEK